MKLDWFKILVVGWLGLTSVSVWDKFSPPSNYMEVFSVVVSDTRPGITPSMKVDRAVKKNFTAMWLVEVERMNTAEHFVMECSASGVNNYSPENDLPEELTLDWWTYPKDCVPVIPGVYRVETTWTVQTSSGVVKQIRALSNNFSVS